MIRRLLHRSMPDRPDRDVAQASFTVNSSLIRDDAASWADERRPTLDDRIRRLWSRLKAHGRGKVQRGVRYSAELWAEVVGLAREAHWPAWG